MNFQVFHSLQALTPSGGNDHVVTVEPTIDAEEAMVVEPKEENSIDTTVTVIDLD